MNQKDKFTWQISYQSSKQAEFCAGLQTAVERGGRVLWYCDLWAERLGDKLLFVFSPDVILDWAKNTN